MAQMSENRKQKVLNKKGEVTSAQAEEAMNEAFIENGISDPRKDGDKPKAIVLIKDVQIPGSISVNENKSDITAYVMESFMGEQEDHYVDVDVAKIVNQAQQLFMNISNTYDVEFKMTQKAYDEYYKTFSNDLKQMFDIDFDKYNEGLGRDNVDALLPMKEII